MNNPWNPDELRFCPAFATPPQAPRALDGDASRHASVLVEKIGKYHGNIMTSELISGKMMIDDEKWWKWSACKHKPWEMMTNETGGKYSVNFKKWFRHVPNFRAWMKMMEGVKRKHQSIRNIDHLQKLAWNSARCWLFCGFLRCRWLCWFCRNCSFLSPWECTHR